MPVPGTTALGNGDLLQSEQILYCVASGIAGLTNLASLVSQASDLFRLPLEDDLSPEPACIGADVDKIVGGSHDILVVLHHDHRIPQCLQIFQHMDKTVCIACVQADARLVEDIE